VRDLSSDRPKSNAVYAAFERRNPTLPRPPLNRAVAHPERSNCVDEGVGYAEGYKYAHDYEGAHVEQDYLPERLRGRVYYRPPIVAWRPRSRSAWRVAKERLNAAAAVTLPVFR